MLDMLNHSIKNKNCEHKFLKNKGSFELRALRNIQRGEELLHNYFVDDTDEKDKAHYLLYYGFMNEECDFQI